MAVNVETTFVSKDGRNEYSVRFSEKDKRVEIVHTAYSRLSKSPRRRSKKQDDEKLTQSMKTISINLATLSAKEYEMFVDTLNRAALFIYDEEPEKDEDDLLE